MTAALSALPAASCTESWATAEACSRWKSCPMSVFRPDEYQSLLSIFSRVDSYFICSRVSILR